MNNELKLHIKKLQIRAFFSLVAILICVISFFLCFCSLSDFSLFLFFLILFIVGVLYLVYYERMLKKEEKEAVFGPVVFERENNFTFEEVITIFEKITDKVNIFTLSDDAVFFRLKKIFELRVILFRTVDFDKKYFNNTKEQINKKANKEFDISSSINSSVARKMLRLNIIYTGKLNEQLHHLISQNAERNLARVEGIMNIVIVGKKIIIPPLYGDCDFVQIYRYKNMIKFINQIML